MKRKSILVMIIMLMVFAFQYADKDVCHAAGKVTDYGTVSKNGEVLYIVIDGLICPKTTELYCPNLAQIYVRQSYGILSV